ncbi:MAG: DUF6049 family protein, partial [Microlunatus sp.]|nr:DUF6049 family protein [Microlunatus sp.]
MKAVRALLAALVMAAMALPLLLATPSAHAKEPESWAKISIDSVSPALPQRDRGGADVIRLAGRITNTSEVELSNLQVAFWRSLDPITNGEGMDRALESAANVPLGERAQGGSLYVDVPSDEDRTLAPEKSTTFAIEATLAQLELPDIDGVYLIGVHLRGRTEPDGPDITLGRGRIFLPVVSSPPAQQVQQTSVVLLTSRPSLLRARVLLDDHLVDEVGTDGRLTRLLQAAGATGTSFAVDPALVQEVQTMVNGYRVLDSAGSTTERPGSAAARAWLSKLSDLIRTGDGYRLLYGNPDIAALVHADLRSGLAESGVASKRVEATEELPLLILPGGGTADAETVAAAAKL